MTWDLLRGVSGTHRVDKHNKVGDSSKDAILGLLFRLAANMAIGKVYDSTTSLYI